MTLFSSGLGRTSLGVPYKDSTQLIITWVWRNLWIQCIEWYWNTNCSIARVSFENRIDAKSFLNSLARLRMNKWMNNSIINSGILMCQIFFSRVYHLFNSDWARILFLFTLYSLEMNYIWNIELFDPFINI